MKSRIVILFFTSLCVFAVFNVGKYKKLFEYDKIGYYLYLPAAFIHHDLAYLSIHKQYDETMYGIYKDSITQRKFTKYPVGLAVLEMPFFFIADAYSNIAHIDKALGYGPQYGLAVCLSSIFWVMIGLFYLRRLLLRYFNDDIVATTLLLILFATNLYQYALFDQGMSHPYSFALFAVYLFCTDSWYRSGKGKYAVCMGTILGIITIVRPTNIALLIVAILWGIATRKDILERLKFFGNNKKPIVGGMIAFFFVLMIQLSYWKYITNHWFIFSYTEEHFDWLDPHIIDGLFSYRKGWFVYTPLAYFFIAGMFLLYKYYRSLFWSITAFFIINLYIVFSWYFWAYGGGFSARALIESYAILAFPLACCIRWIIKPGKAKQYKIILATVVFVVLIQLNILQTYQVNHNFIKWDETTKEEYWQSFGKYKW